MGLLRSHHVQFCLFAKPAESRSSHLSRDKDTGMASLAADVLEWDVPAGSADFKGLEGLVQARQGTYIGVMCTGALSCEQQDLWDVYHQRLLKSVNDLYIRRVSRQVLVKKLMITCCVAQAQRKGPFMVCFLGLMTLHVRH
jgi:hypothetical protein